MAVRAPRLTPWAGKRPKREVRTYAAGYEAKKILSKRSELVPRPGEESAVSHLLSVRHARKSLTIKEGGPEAHPTGVFCLRDEESGRGPALLGGRKTMG